MVQLNGTGKLVPFTITEIITDNDFLEKFSISDIKFILQLYYEAINTITPKYLLSSRGITK